MAPDEEEVKVKIAKTIRDRLFTYELAIGIFGFAYLSLLSVNYPLGFNIHTLFLLTVSCSLLASSYLEREVDIDRQFGYAILCLIPIGLRTLINEVIFGSFVESLTQDLWFGMQILFVWTLVALGEECFRATMLIFTEFFTDSLPLQWVLSNTAWVILHFVQRPYFQPYYLLWLYATGLVLTFILQKAGLGSAVLAHIIINLTA